MYCELYSILKNDYPFWKLLSQPKTIEQKELFVHSS